jgi:hypothetical protein
MAKFLIGAVAVLTLGPGLLGQAGPENRPVPRDPRVHALVRGQLRSLDVRQGTLEMITASGLVRISNPNMKVIAPGGQVYPVADCPRAPVRPGRRVTVLTSKSGDVVEAVIVDLRRAAR